MSIDSLYNVNILPLVVTVIIAVIGWIFTSMLQYKSIKHQHKVQIRYDIYKQFISLHKEIENSISTLGAHTGSPFIQMSSSMIPFELGLKKEYKGQWILWNEEECVFEGEKKWTSFVQELYDSYFDFSKKFLKMRYVAEDWAAALEPLLPAKEALFKEIERFKAQIYGQLEILQMHANKYGHDWRKWDQEDIGKVTRSISEDALVIGSYMHDFMVLIHNELLSSHFGHRRPTRKTLDLKFKVLTKDGIVENVDWDKINNMGIWKTQLVSYANAQLKKSALPSSNISSDYKKYLNFIVDGICPNCKTPIFIIEAENSENSFCYRYACGHGWNGIVLEETIGIKELYKLKSMRKGFGLVRRVVQGWKPSGDIKLKNGVDVYMDVNREKDEYHQIVKEHQTQNILHEEHEPLTKHGKVAK